MLFDSNLLVLNKVYNDIKRQIDYVCCHDINQPHTELKLILWSLWLYIRIIGGWNIIGNRNQWQTRVLEFRKKARVQEM